MWVLINNNIITKNIYVGFMSIDFILQLLIVLCLYSEVGAVPAISDFLIGAFDYQNATVVGIVAVTQAAILTITLSVICVLVFKEFSWQVYSEKKFIF